MKTILLILLPLFSLAQVDTSIVEIQTDEMTGHKSIVSKMLHLHNDGIEAIRIFAMKGETKTVIISIRDVSGSLKCVDENNKVNILFTDGSRMELYHNSSFNCQGKSVLYFRGLFGKGGKLDEMKSKPIAAIRIWGMSTYSDAKFDKEQAENFMKALQIIDEYKF